HAKPFRNEFLLCLPGMHENHVGIAAARGVERLAGTLGDDFNDDAGLLLEQRQDVAEQTGVDVVEATTMDLACARAGAAATGGIVGGKTTRLRRVGMMLSSSCACRDTDNSQTSSSPAVNRRASSVLGAEKKASAELLSITRPRCMSTISPARRLASPRSCVDITTLIPRAATL